MPAYPCHGNESWLGHYKVCLPVLLRPQEHALERNNQGRSLYHPAAVVRGPVCAERLFWVWCNGDGLGWELQMMTIPQLDGDALGQTIHLDQDHNLDIALRLIWRRVIEPPVLVHA